MRSPFEPLDKAFFAGTRAPWASFAPVWKLEYRGALTHEQLNDALTRTLARYPSCRARVVALDRPFDRARRFAWEIPDEPPPPRLEVLDLRAVSADEAARREQAVADRFLDLEREPPFLCTWIRRTDDSGVIALQQHHSLADGRAFLALIADLMRALASPAPLDPRPVVRRSEREALGRLTLGDRARGLVAFVAELLRSFFAPLTPLRSNTGSDYSGENRTHHFFIAARRLDAWRTARSDTGLSTNDLLAGALCAALARWSARHGTPPGTHNLFMPIDLRPRDGAFESFANHLSSIQLRWRGQAGSQPLELARQLHAASTPMLAARLPRRRAPFDGALMRLSPIHVLRTALLDRRRLLTNYSFSNLIPLALPAAGDDHRWHFGAAVVEKLLITTPCTPPQAANTTVIRYGDSLCFNFNHKASALETTLVEDLAREFSRCLDEIDAALRTARSSPPG